MSHDDWCGEMDAYWEQVLQDIEEMEVDAAVADDQEARHNPYP